MVAFICAHVPANADQRGNMKYYAMICGERRGPYELEMLSEAGVRPDTYVWCKGMADWELAKDVPDVCRMFRRRIYDLMHPGSLDSQRERENAVAQEKSAELRAGAGLMRRAHSVNDQIEEQGGLPTVAEIEERKPKDVAPENMTLWAVLAIVVFFPFGIRALIYSNKSKMQWKQQAEMPEDKSSLRKGLREEAHENCRAAKMWAGISLFIGLIFWAYLLSTL